MDALILLVSFLVLMFLGIPVAYAMGLATLITALWIDIPLEAVMLKISDGMDDFALLTIPFFVGLRKQGRRSGRSVFPGRRDGRAKVW